MSDHKMKIHMQFSWYGLDCEWEDGKSGRGVRSYRASKEFVRPMEVIAELTKLSRPGEFRHRNHWLYLSQGEKDETLEDID